MHMQGLQKPMRKHSSLLILRWRARRARLSRRCRAPEPIAEGLVKAVGDTGQTRPILQVSWHPKSGVKIDALLGAADAQQSTLLKKQRAPSCYSINQQAAVQHLEPVLGNSQR